MDQRRPEIYDPDQGSVSASQHEGVSGAVEERGDLPKAREIGKYRTLLWILTVIGAFTLGRWSDLKDPGIPDKLIHAETPKDTPPIPFECQLYPREDACDGLQPADFDPRVCFVPTGTVLDMDNGGNGFPDRCPVEALKLVSIFTLMGGEDVEVHEALGIFGYMGRYTGSPLEPNPEALARMKQMLQAYLNYVGAVRSQIMAECESYGDMPFEPIRCAAARSYQPPVKKQTPTSL